MVIELTLIQSKLWAENHFVVIKKKTHFVFHITIFEKGICNRKTIILVSWSREVSRKKWLRLSVLRDWCWRENCSHYWLDWVIRNHKFYRIIYIIFRKMLKLLYSKFDCIKNRNIFWLDGIGFLKKNILKFI